MFKMRSIMLMLLSALLPAHNLVIEGVTPASPGSTPASCKEFTFSAEDFKNANSDEELLTIWRSKMVDVENFLRQTLLVQHGEMNINTAIIPHGVTTTASTTVETGTITSNRITAPIATSLGGTSTIISSDASSLAPIATSIVGTRTITSNYPTLPTPIATVATSSITSSDATWPTYIATNIGGTCTITSNDPTSLTPIATSIVGTSSITSSDATWPTYLATSIGGTSTITSNNPTSPKRIATSIVGTSTITSDHATLPTPVATTNVQETVTTSSQCEFNVSDICYWSYGKKPRDINFTEAIRICADKGSVPAYFPTALAYNKTMESLRAKIKAVGKTWANAYTGVLLDKQTWNVTYPDTKVYMKWKPGNPKSCKGCTRVVLRFDLYLNSINQGMWNYPPSARAFGVVCQKNLN